MSRRQQNREHDRRRREEVPWRGWYKTARWQRLRQIQLNAEPVCRMCKQQDRTTEARVADHVIPHRGDPDLFWHGELQSLCLSCHSGAKQREEKSGGFGSDSDGRPLSPDHPWNQ